MDHFGLFTLFNFPANQQFDKCQKETLQISSFYMSVPKTILIWLIVTKKWCANLYRLFRPLLPFPHFLAQKMKIFEKKRYLEISSFYTHRCTKYHNRMIFNSQNGMWMALQVILGDLWLLASFLPKKQNF